MKKYNEGAHGIPELLKVEVARLALANLPLHYTRHALSESLHDRYGVLPAASFPRTFNIHDSCELVEVESVDGSPDKFVVRKPVDARRSLVLVILRNGTVKTLWTNLNTDTHKTLDKSKFDRP